MAGNAKELVLVTGGTGFVGVHCIVKCLNSNYRVRTTIRSLQREKYVRDMLTEGGITNFDDVSFIEADLTKDDNWNEAVKGCSYVLHVASPFPGAEPKNPDDLIIPAREGTLRVLRAARDAGVKRIVITSSFAAVGYGHKEYTKDRVFTEKDWSDPDGPNVLTYWKSKTLAERAAWDFIEKEGGSLELSVINPTGIFGPVLGRDDATSSELIVRLMNGAVPGCPNIYISTADVRDVADMHLIAMTHPKAKGERFICTSPPQLTIKEISLALRERLGHAARKAPRISIPDFVLKIMGVFDPTIALVVPELSKPRRSSVDKAKDLLGWEPRPGIDAHVAMAESLIKYGLVKS